MSQALSRRQFTQSTAAFALTAGLRGGSLFASEQAFHLKYIVASCMYGTLPLEEVLAEVHKTGASDIDIWPRVHANHREQIEEMGVVAFENLLGRYKTRLGMLTRYDLGPFKLHGEMEFLRRFGGKIIISGSRGRKDDSLKKDVQKFVEELKPHVEVAAENGIVMGIENHANALIHSPDSIRYFADSIDSDHLGIALAPYHLPQDTALLSSLIEDISPRMVHFYAWEHGMGCHKKIPKVQEMKQLPGYGALDFTPILSVLKKIDYHGWVSIFMHPVPRGIPILPTAPEVTAAINRSREYLEDCLRRL